MTCPDCGLEPGIGQWPFRCKGTGEHDLRPRRAQNIDPVVVHRAKDGTYRFPGSADAPIPAGYEKVELRTLAEVDAFSKKVNQHDRSIIDRHVERECQQIEALEAQQRPELRAAMQRMTPAQRALAEHAIRVNNSRRPKGFDSGFHLEIREMDASNRDAHRDVRTGWRGRK
jgi:hypothetical protein